MLEDLIFNSKFEKEYNIGNNKIKIRLLSNDEMAKVLESQERYKNDSAKVYDMLQELLSRSIISVNGKKTEYKENREKISLIPEVILVQIYEKYTELKNEQNNLLQSDSDIKN